MRTVREAREPFFPFLPLRSTYEHLDIYLQLCMCGGCNGLLIAPLVIITLLLDEIYQLEKLPFNEMRNSLHSMIFLFNIL